MFFPIGLSFIRLSYQRSFSKFFPSLTCFSFFFFPWPLSLPLFFPAFPFLFFAILFFPALFFALLILSLLLFCFFFPSFPFFTFVSFFFFFVLLSLFFIFSYL